MALLFLFSSQLSRLSAPPSELESGKAIDREAAKKATPLYPQAVGLIPDPAGIKVSLIDQRIDSSVDAPLHEATRKLHVVSSYPKNHVKTVYGTRLVANPAARRSNSHPRSFFLEIAHQFGALMSRLQTIGTADRFIQKESLVVHTNGRPRKEMRTNDRRTRRRLMSSFRAARFVGLRAQATKDRKFAVR
jgi:hypothetical protein